MPGVSEKEIKARTAGVDQCLSQQEIACIQQGPTGEAPGKSVQTLGTRFNRLCNILLQLHNNPVMIIATLPHGPDRTGRQQMADMPCNQGNMPKYNRSTEGAGAPPSQPKAGPVGSWRPTGAGMAVAPCSQGIELTNFDSGMIPGPL